MYTIGQFSKISGFTIKTLRFYHERGLLVPSCVDDETGYRYYNAAAAERARVIVALRDLGFSVADILGACEDQSDMIEYLEHRRAVLQERVRVERKVLKQLDAIIFQEQEARAMVQNSTFKVEEKELPALLIAGVRMKGKYSECGKGFSKLGRSYENVFAYVEAKGYKTLLPSREVYLKGPGMIFRGNPRKYLTEIQIMIDEG